MAGSTLVPEETTVVGRAIRTPKAVFITRSFSQKEGGYDNYIRLPRSDSPGPLHPPDARSIAGRRRHAAMGLGGAPVGLLHQAVRFETVEVPFEPGDLFVFYTDGITEAEDPSGVDFGRGAAFATSRFFARATGAGVEIGAATFASSGFGATGSSVISNFTSSSTAVAPASAASPMRGHTT